MANSYHMEALRKQRLLDRKNEALRRLEKQGTDLTKDAVMDGYLSKQTPKESPLITNEGQFNQQRSSNSSYQYMSTLPREEGVVFGEVVHDPNFKYRILKSAGSAPVHVDPIHKIMYPDPCHHNRKHRLENESIPNLPPPTILAIQRDHVYKIFHPYDFHS